MGPWGLNLVIHPDAVDLPVARFADTDMTEQGCTCHSGYRVRDGAGEIKTFSGCMETPMAGFDEGASRGYPSWCYTASPCLAKKMGEFQCGPTAP